MVQKNTELYIAASTALQNLTSELKRISEMANEVDNAVGEMIELGTNSPVPVALLQKVDLLRQSTNCLERFATNFATQSMCDHKLGVEVLADGIYLDDMRRALTADR